MELKYLPNDQKDSIDANGNKFWSGNKLYPTPIDFDEMVGVSLAGKVHQQNTTHLQFVDYAAILHAQSLGITVNEDKEYFMKYGFGGKFIVV